MHILFVMPVAPEQRERILDVVTDDVTVSWDRDSAVARHVPVTAVIGGPAPETVEHLHQLEWVQFRSDSLEKWGETLQLLSRRHVTVTRTSGSYNETVPDHALMLILALARDLPSLLTQREEGRWGGQGLRTTSIAGARMAVVGFGSIGRGIAKRAVALGMQVIGVDPVQGEVPAGVEDVVSPESLLEAVADADFVVACTPHTPATVRLIGADVIGVMKPSAHIVNVGRGVAVDTKALLTALDEGRLAGAGLDVTEPSPPPPGHLLWTHPRVLLTCHSAPQGSHPDQVQFELILDNLKRYVEGRPLRMQIDPSVWS